MITSFGIILYSIKDGKKYFLVGKRMDSLEFLDLFNSRCPVEKVQGYVCCCTDFEINKLVADNFDHIYRDSFASHREYRELYERWKKIKPFIAIGLDRCEKYHKSTCMYSLPKGKKKSGESQEEAALREFEEETHISRSQIKKAFYPTYSTIFRGTDDKMYKTVYYVYKCDQLVEVEPKWRDSPYAHRHYSISEEMEELIWVPTESLPDYLPDYLVDVLRQI